MRAPLLAGQDDLKGGSVVLKLQKSHGLKLKPANVTFAITGGAVDPVDGSGPVQVSGSVKARRGKGKTKIKFTTFTLGASGGQGTIVAKVGKDFVNGFGTLSGGTVTRDGWGARIENVSAKISAKGARALNRALSGTKGKGASKSAKGGVKAGQPLGTIKSITTDPLDVQVVPNTGSMTLTTNLGGAFAAKLPQHCVSLLGVTAIAPAVMEVVPPGAFTFPVSVGSAAPDFSAGELFTAGGQIITKDNGLGTPGACASAGPPVGSHLLSTELSVAFGQNQLRAIATLPSGVILPRAPLADIDFSTGTRSIDPGTKSLSITGATARLASLAAPLLNQNFPTESGNASDDFAAGDLIGTIDVTGVQLR